MYGWIEKNYSDIAAADPNLTDKLLAQNHLKLALIALGLQPEVKLLNQTEVIFSPEESKLVCAERGWIREIYFMDDKNALTYGRTLVPEQTYQQFHSEFLSLGSRPIGELLLHRKPNVNREAFEFGQIPKTSNLFQYATQNCQETAAFLWGRRSRFLIESYPLIIIELFFSSLQKYFL